MGKMPGPVSDTMPTLADRMRLLAENRTDIRDEFVALADKLDALDGSDIPKLVGTWAKARRRWCEVTGEPLI